MLFSRSKKAFSGTPFSQPDVWQLYPGNKVLQVTAERARNGDHDAQYEMGVYHSQTRPRDVVLALMYLRDAARAGHIQARMQVAMTIMQGFDEVSAYGSFTVFCAMLPLNLRGFNTEETWIVDEAKAGSNTFRFIYCMGLHSREPHGALSILTEDAKMGSMLAMGALAYCYSSGRGTPQNQSESYVWANLAAATGLKLAVEDRDYLAQKLTPLQLGLAQDRATVLFNEIFGPDSPLSKVQAAVA